MYWFSIFLIIIWDSFIVFFMIFFVMLVLFSRREIWFCVFDMKFLFFCFEVDLFVEVEGILMEVFRIWWYFCWVLVCSWYFSFLKSVLMDFCFFCDVDVKLRLIRIGFFFIRDFGFLIVVIGFMWVLVLGLKWCIVFKCFRRLFIFFIFLLYKL